MASIRVSKKQNQYRIIRLLLEEGTMTRQEIAQRLQISMPTTLQNTNELLETGLLEEAGAMESTGGRRAKKLVLKGDAGLALGIDIALHQVEFVITDLRGKVRIREVLPSTFQDDIEWYQEFQQSLEAFFASHEVETGRILGAGVCFPGVIDDAEDMIVRSHIFELEHVSLNRFKKCIPFPMIAANDANCACFAELTKERQSFFYISLNESVGGAIIKDGKLCYGDTWQAGEIGHMLLIPNGRKCYCGKHGCADPYLSPNVLRENGCTLDEFFEQVESGEPDACKRWDSYLEYLAIMVTNLRMVYNSDIVIGGAVGTKIKPYLPKLNQKAAKLDLFARDIDYIYPCSRNTHAFAAGAAMLALERNLSHLLDDEFFRTKGKV